MQFKTDFDKAQYIKLQMDGNSLLLQLFPMIRYYYNQMYEYYNQRSNGTTDAQAVNKRVEILNDMGLKPHFVDESEGLVVVTQKSIDILQLNYSLEVQKQDYE